MKKKLVTLALQGGGSHGAFTWGVLDRLLEEDGLEIEAISGASAGAVNAVALAHGYTLGGRAGAREALRSFWGSVASKAPFSFAPNEAYAPDKIELHATPAPVLSAWLSFARFFSPYQLNPFDINPLRDILAHQIDFARLRSDCPIKLFVAATRVSDGTLKLFRNKQMSLESVLASACLPAIHHAVEIDGEAYWDGGFTANPPLFPLLHQCTARDIVLILLDGHPRQNTPSTADEIFARLTEIGFGAALATELQGIALAKREAQRARFAFGRLERRLRNLNVHSVEAREFMSLLSGHSRMNTNAPFLHALRDEGRKQAEHWLEKNFDQLGVRSSLRLARFLR